MTKNETIVLLLALKVNGRLRYRAVYYAMGGERAWSILNGLRNAGALDHPAYDHWEITEKGRIAAALLLAKDARLAEAFGVAA
jgi:hypothetical protein